MREVKIQAESKDLNDGVFCNKIIQFLELLFDTDYKGFKYYFFILILILFTIITLYELFYSSKIIDLKLFKKYVRDSKNYIMYNRKKIFNENPFIAICLPAFNMEKYIKRNIISILNQSFQDFEIIVVNDNSDDNTENIIKNIQLDDDRIKLVSHSQNLGVYRSRIESILNSKSKFLLLMDSADMLLNENLFLELYNYNAKNNLDIIEFSVCQQIEGKNKIYLPKDGSDRHYHEFNNNIIYQPELSEILYYTPGTNEYNYIICRNIFNKLIRRNLLVQTYKFIGKEYYHKFIITADDMIMNIVSYQFAKNYSNINLPGYLNVIKSYNRKFKKEYNKQKHIKIKIEIFCFMK
jgi:glycosyltransferase involved in cell wall biosynthesis